MKPQRLAWSLAVISIAVMIAGITMSLQYVISTGNYRALVFHQFLIPLSTVGYVIVGALIASRYPQNPIGWIYVAVGMLYSLLALAVGYSLSGPVLGAQVAGWLSDWIWVPTIVLPTTYVFLLFPDGHLLSSRWRLVAWSAALGLIAATIGVAFEPTLMAQWQAMPVNPFASTAGSTVLNGITFLGNILLTVGVIGSVASLIVRYRRSKDIEKEQMKWLVYAAGLMIVGIIVGSVMTAIWPNAPLVYELTLALTSIVILAIAVAACVAILRYRLYDINIIINRTLVYGTLTGGVVILYILVVGVASLFIQNSGNLIISLLATGLVAVLFQPLRERLQRAVNRLMYGERDDPVAALSKLKERLEATNTPQAILPNLVETIAHTLKLPYAAIILENDDQPIAAYGLPANNITRFSLIYQAETIGYLIVAQRGVNEAFSPADMALLENIAHQAGTTVYAVQLTDALQRSRQALVTAREEERRRLRRDLHDGLGPSLASLALQADTAKALLHTDLPEVESLLSDITAEALAAVEDIRRLVYNLRPPALDELGLVDALQNQFQQQNRAGLAITIDVPAPLPPLPAAVEVAAYRIVQEGVNNVVQHAQAHHCTVGINCNESLVSVVISDDGRGLPPQPKAGVGLISMRERAEELGGSLEVYSSANRGASIRALLPL